MSKTKEVILIVIAALLLGMFLGRLGLSQTGNALKSVVEPGSMTGEASYIIFTDGSTIYARNGTTGEIEFQSTNASSVLQNIVNVMRTNRVENGVDDAGGLIFIAGYINISVPINMTFLRNLRIGGLSGKPGYYPNSEIPSSGFRIQITGNTVAFDLTGSKGVEFDHLSFIVDSGYSPKAIVLLARPQTTPLIDAGYHTFSDCTFEGNTTVALLYIYGSEFNRFDGCNFNSPGRQVVISATNTVFNMTSPFHSLFSGPFISTNQNYFDFCNFYRTPDETSDETIFLEGCNEAEFHYSYFSAGTNNYNFKTSNITNTELLTCDNCHFETGGLLTVNNAPWMVDLLHFSFTNCYFSGASYLPSGIIIDCNKNNILVEDISISNWYILLSGNTSLNFWALYDPIIYLPTINVPYTYIIASSSGGEIHTYNATYIADATNLGTLFYYQSRTGGNIVSDNRGSWSGRYIVFCELNASIPMYRRLDKLTGALDVNWTSLGGSGVASFYSVQVTSDDLLSVSVVNATGATYAKVVNLDTGDIVMDYTLIGP